MVDFAHLFKHIIIFVLGFGISFILIMFLSAFGMNKHRVQTRYTNNLKDASIVKAIHKGKEFMLINPTSFKQTLYILVVGTWWFYNRKQGQDILPRNEKAENILLWIILLILAILLIISGELMYVVVTTETPHHIH